MSDAPHFDGETYVAARDHTRLTGLMHEVYAYMKDGEWHNLHSIYHGIVGGTEASVSARLRDLRKPKFGGYRVERRYVSNGIFEYRLLKPLDAHSATHVAANPE